MTTGTVKSQGTELFVIDDVTVPETPAVMKLACPTGINGLGGAADQIEDTCLDATEDKTYKRGLGNPGQVTVPFNFIPTNATHQTILFDMKADGGVKKWMACLSDGTGNPTITTGELTAVAARSCLAFEAYVADVNIDIATNDLVRGTLILQRSGTVTLTPKSA